jgi:hypothetical protein
MMLLMEGAMIQADVTDLGLDRGGRPPGRIHRSIRLKHIRCAYHRLIAGRSIRWLAAHYRVSARTVHLWINAALSYTDDESLILRQSIRGGAA